MYKYPMGKFRGMKMSHMITDNERDENELHEMALKIGLKRAWFQGDHYDVSEGKRQIAIANGAIPVTMRELGKIVIEKRGKQNNVRRKNFISR
jgi:hypothetical protein